MTSKTQATKGENDKPNFIEIKTFLCFKGHNQVQRHSTEWEKTFTNHIADK